MITMRRNLAFAFAGTCIAGWILFASYCSLHSLVLGVSLPWTVPTTWGLLTGAPAGALLYTVWQRHGATRPQPSLVILAAVFFAIVAWGVLVRGAIGPGRLPELRSLAEQFFVVVPVAAALAAACALLSVFRARAKIQEAVSPWIHLPEEPLLRLRFDQINWISAAGNYCEFHAPDRIHLVRVSLARMAERLDQHGFARVHRSALVNLSAVQSIERPPAAERPVARLRCGTNVPVGRRFQSAILAAAGCRSSHV